MNTEFKPPTATNTANTDACNESARLMNTVGGGKNVEGSVKGGTKSTTTGTVENIPVKSRHRVLLFTDNVPSNNARGVGSNNEDLFYQVDSLLNLFAHTRDNSLLNSAKSINSGIITVGQIQQNQKEFNAIYAVYLDNDSLVSSNQVEDLKELAVLCPITDGLVVYQARGLIRNWDDSTEYFNECERNLPEIANSEPAQRLLNSSQDNLGLVKPLNVYPNPNNGKLTIENSPENSIFELYDIVGRKVYTNTLGNVTQLDLNSFNNGTYLYRITLDTKLVKEDKLIINK